MSQATGIVFSFVVVSVLDSGCSRLRLRGRRQDAGRCRRSWKDSAFVRCTVVLTGNRAAGCVQIYNFHFAFLNFQFISFGPVSPVSANFYSQWRVRSGVVPLLRDDHDSPPERLLQSVWQHQRLVRDHLTTLDGRQLRVLHPGFRNVEGGPDFRGALVQFDDDPPQTGDVEVDLRSGGWHAHGHDRNPAFQQVILHAIWEGELAAAGTPPVLLLRPVLDAPIGELSLWLGGEAAADLPAEWRGHCCAPLRRLTPAEVTALLHEAAQVRLQSKAAQFQARARQVGWEQALWEGVLRALGYKHNVWPMHRLAELRPHWSAWARPPLGGLASLGMNPGKHELAGSDPGAPADGGPATVPSRPRGRVETEVALTFQARLLGLSGLLPAELTRAQGGTDDYLRRIWDLWWRERDAFSDYILPRALWRLHGLRPANHPQRRLALASHWSAASDLAQRLEAWGTRELTDRASPGSLLETLQVQPDDFWSWHWTFRSPRLARAQPLLGATRVTDLAVNVVLPWLWMRAVEGKNESVQRRVEQRYFAWPPAEDNAVLRLARQRLLAGAARRFLPGAAAQQGLIQMVRDFCDHANSVCEGCKLPELVRAWAGNSRPRNPDSEAGSQPATRSDSDRG